MHTPPVMVWGEGEPVVLVHGSSHIDPAIVWSNQRPLAAYYQLLVITRPGYGERPLLYRATVAPDVEEILALLQQIGGAHLIGFSYGGSISMIAAGQRPDLIRSLAVIEPPAFAVARGHPAVEEHLSILRTAYETEPPLTTEEFLVRFMKAIDRDFPNKIRIPPERRKGIEAIRAEPGSWTLEIPLAALAATSFPKLVVSGGWHPAFEAVADVLTERLSAERFICQGKGHYILDTGERLNQRLEAFLQAAGG